MDIKIVALTIDKIKDVNKSNQDFYIIGELVPGLVDGEWSATEKIYKETIKKKYPNEETDCDKYIDSDDRAFYLAYDKEDNCVAHIRLKKYWNNYCYIEDIAVAQAYRDKGIGAKLLETAQKWADKNKLTGLMIETQNTNLLACRFYFKQGFSLGAVDTMLYSGLKSDEYALFFYRKSKK